jgi:hypothetical protein
MLTLTVFATVFPTVANATRTSEVPAVLKPVICAVVESTPFEEHVSSASAIVVVEVEVEVDVDVEVEVEVEVEVVVEVIVPIMFTASPISSQATLEPRVYGIARPLCVVVTNSYSAAAIGLV